MEQNLLTKSLVYFIPLFERLTENFNIFSFIFENIGTEYNAESV